MLVAKQPLYQPEVPLWQSVPRASKKKKKTVISSKEKRFILLAVLFLAVCSLGLIWRFAAINDMQYKVTKLQQRIDSLEKDNASLTVELKRLSAPRQLEERATRELGMQWPTPKQIINVQGGQPSH